MSTSVPARRQLSPLEPLVRAIENAEPLDEPAQQVAAAVRSNVTGTLKDVVSGTWLGHALHPMLTDVVIGSFLSATLLDLLGGEETSDAAGKLIGIGIVAYAPTALAGASDWADAEPVDSGVRRAGLVHAGGNLVALTLYARSRRARRKGRYGRAKFLTSLGGMVLGVGGFVGGYLTMSKGIGPDQTAFDPGSEEWTAVGEAGSLVPGEPVRVVADDTPVLLLRQGEELLGIHDRCSHRGCSLSDGEIEVGQVTCACHGSRFDLRTGALLQGPATAPQPAFDVREQDGRIEVRRRPDVPA